MGNKGTKEWFNESPDAQEGNIYPPVYFNH